MDTTATPTLTLLGEHIRQQLIPAMISREGKFFGRIRTELPDYSSDRDVQRGGTVRLMKPLLSSLQFLPHLTTASRNVFESKVNSDFFNYFNASQNSSRPLISSDQGKELIGNLVKGFYGAFPFVEKRRVVLSLRDLSLNVMTNILVEGNGSTPPTNLLRAIEEFNHGVDYFHASATPYTDPSRQDGNHRFWAVKIGDHTRVLYNGATTHNKSINHPAFKASVLLYDILRRMNASNPLHSVGAVHLNKYLLEDLDTVFSFLKYFLEYLPCKTVS